MTSDVFQRIGRGGAGNFLTKKDVEAAERRQSEDLEAQKISTTPQGGDLAAAQSAQGYSRAAGRGGAGNFHDASVRSDEAQQQEREDAERTRAQVSASLSKNKPVLTGRGGLGNWTESSAQRPPQGGEDEEKRRADALEAKILQDVEAGLKPPAPAYHQPDRAEGD